MTTLVGQWEGTADEGGKRVRATTSFRLGGGGSALMDTLGEATEHEMVTVFHQK